MVRARLVLFLLVRHLFVLEAPRFLPLWIMDALAVPVVPRVEGRAPEVLAIFPAVLLLSLPVSQLVETVGFVVRLNASPAEIINVISLEKYCTFACISI